MPEQDNKNSRTIAESSGNRPYTPEEQEKIVLEKIMKNAQNDAKEFLAHFQQMSSGGVFKVLRGFSITDKDIYEAAYTAVKKYNLSEKDKDYYLKEFLLRCTLGYPLGEA